MANIIYPYYKQLLLSGGSNTSLNGSGTTGVYVALLDSSYTYNINHKFYSDLTGIVDTDKEIATPKTFTNGVFKGADVSFTGIGSGISLKSLVIYIKNAGASTTWVLVAYIDSNITGLPMVTSGGNLQIAWNSSGVFAL